MLYKDASGKDQQEINNLWNLFVNAKNDGSQDVSEIFTNYCNALNDGDAVVIPKGEYFWDSTLGTRVITKNINIECRGVFKVKPSANQMLIFSGGDGLLINAYRTGHGHIKFKVKNLTEAEITILAGSVIHFVIQ